MNCKAIKILVETEVLADLATETLAAVRFHSDACPKCRRLVDEALSRDELLTAALIDGSAHIADGSLARGVPRFGAGPRWILAAFSLALAGVVGYYIGAIGFSPPVQSAYASVWHFEPSEVVQGIAHPGFEMGVAEAEGFEKGGSSGWVVQSARYPCVVVDHKRVRSGRSSLRLMHKYGGGSATLSVPVPIPPGTVLTVLAWVNSPRGGSRQNKWLSPGLSLPGSGRNGMADEGTSIDIMQPTFGWQQVQLRWRAVNSADGVAVSFSTGTGDGKDENGNPYLANDWASWVDDIQVSIILTPLPDTNRTTIDGDRIVVEFTMPGVYSAGNLDFGSLRLEDGNFGTYEPIAPESHETDGKKVRLVFRSKKAADQLKAGNPDIPMDNAVARVRGYVQWGVHRLPFLVGVNGPKPPMNP